MEGPSTAGHSSAAPKNDIPESSATHPIMLHIPQSVLEKPDSLEVLDRGSFGTVYLYESSPHKAAIKQIKTSKASYSVEEDTTAIFAEIELQRKLDHINIVQYYGSYVAKQHILIIMELAEHGSLKSHLMQLNQKAEKLGDGEVLDITKQILNGLNYLHKQDKPIIHRDLRSPNVLLYANDIVKIADFGISKQFNTLASSFSTLAGNPYWQAPEIIDYQKSKVGRKVDIWSVGVTMLEMVHTGKPPLFELEPYQYTYKLCSKKETPAIPDFVNARLQLIISRCLVYDSDKRGTADDILRLCQYDNDNSYPDDNSHSGLTQCSVPDLNRLLAEEYRLFSFDKVVRLEKEFDLTHIHFVEIAVEWIRSNNPTQDMVTQLWGMFRQQELCRGYLAHLYNTVCRSGTVSVPQELADDKYTYWYSVTGLREGADLSSIKVDSQCKKCKKDLSMTVRLVEGTPCYESEAGDAHVVEHVWLDDYNYTILSLLTNSYSVVGEQINEYWRTRGYVGLRVMYTCTAE